MRSNTNESGASRRLGTRTLQRRQIRPLPFAVVAVSGIYFRQSHILPIHTTTYHPGVAGGQPATGYLSLHSRRFEERTKRHRLRFESRSKIVFKSQTLRKVTARNTVDVRDRKVTEGRVSEAGVSYQRRHVREYAGIVQSESILVSSRRDISLTDPKAVRVFRCADRTYVTYGRTETAAIDHPFSNAWQKRSVIIARSHRLAHSLFHKWPGLSRDCFPLLGEVSGLCDLAVLPWQGG